MIREAGPDDRAEIEALLTACIHQAMFPLVNLREHGLGWGDLPETAPQPVGTNHTATRAGQGEALPRPRPPATFQPDTVLHETTRGQRPTGGREAPAKGGAGAGRALGARPGQSEPAAHGEGDGLRQTAGGKAALTPHDHAIRIWRTGNSLIALTHAGMILPLLDGTPDLSGLRTALDGLTLTGAVGPAASARSILKVLGIDNLPTNPDRDEPGFTLDLNHLIIPDLPGTTLRPITPDDLPLLTDWRETYISEVLGQTGPKARRRAKDDLASYLAKDSHRLLLHLGQPVAMTGFNATLPESVQIGGVYTPPALRGKGHARQAVALHLAEARALGVTRAVLFAASEAAARAYQAIGFRRVQDFTLFLLSTPSRITA